MITISFEGPDGCGKATQSLMLKEWFQANHPKLYPVVVLEFPCKENIAYASIIKMLHDGSASMRPVLFQFYHWINKLGFASVLHIHNVLKFIDLSTSVIILDRWRLSGLAYGAASGVPKRLSELMFACIPDADLTIIFHGKQHRTEVRDILESDTDLQDAVQREYYTLATEGSKKPRVLVSTNASPEDVHSRVVTVIKKFLLKS